MGSAFKLQSVLNYRQLLENQAQQALAVSLQEQTRIEQQREALRQQLHRHDRELKERQSQGLTIAEISLYEDQIVHCQRLIDDLAVRQKRLEGIVTVRLWKILKKETEQKQELARQERALLDEISLRGKGES